MDFGLKFVPTPKELFGYASGSEKPNQLAGFSGVSVGGASAAGAPSAVGASAGGVLSAFGSSVGTGTGAGTGSTRGAGAGAGARFWTFRSPSFSNSRKAVSPASPRRRWWRLMTRV